MTQLILPLTIPPSVNHLYRRRGNKTFRTRAYQDWITINAIQIGRVKPWRHYPCRIRLTIYGGKGWTVSRDLDNSLKAVLDLLQHLQILAEDNTKHVHGVEVVYQPPLGAKQDAWAECVIYRGGGRGCDQG